MFAGTSVGLDADRLVDGCDRSCFAGKCARAIGVSDSGDLGADGEAGCGSYRCGFQVRGLRELENGDVVAHVIADNAGGVAVARVRDLDPDRGRAGDHVVVREDLTGRGEDDAGACRGAVCETEFRPRSRPLRFRSPGCLSELRRGRRRCPRRPAGSQAMLMLRASGPLESSGRGDFQPLQVPAARWPPARAAAAIAVPWFVWRTGVDLRSAGVVRSSFLPFVVNEDIAPRQPEYQLRRCCETRVHLPLLRVRCLPALVLLNDSCKSPLKLGDLYGGSVRPRLVGAEVVEVDLAREQVW